MQHLIFYSCLKHYFHIFLVWMLSMIWKSKNLHFYCVFTGDFVTSIRQTAAMETFNYFCLSSMRTYHISETSQSYAPLAVNITIVWIFLTLIKKFCPPWPLALVLYECFWDVVTSPWPLALLLCLMRLG